MIRSEFEDIVITASPYYKDMEHQYRDPVNFQRYINILKRITKPDAFLENLEENAGKELVFLGRSIFSLQDEFVTTYLVFLKDESRVNKWEEFFDRYSKNLFSIYERFIKNYPGRVLIFEIVNRKLLRDLITKHTSGLPIESKPLIAERFGVVINQLFSYIRNSLTRQVRIPDKIISESYEKLPLLPRASRSEMMKMLGRNFIQLGIPEPLYSAVFKAVSMNYFTEEKDQILREINKRDFLTRSEIIEILNSHFFLPDDTALDEILTIVKRKFQETLNSARNRREGLGRKIDEITKKIRETVTGANQELIATTADFSTEESVDIHIKKLRRNLLSLGFDLKQLRRDHQDQTRLETEIETILKIKSTDLAKFIVKNEWDPLLILLLKPVKPLGEEQLMQLLKDVMNDLRGDKPALAVINDLKSTTFLKERYNTSEVMRRFQAANEQLITPLLKSLMVEELIDYYPKLSGGTSAENTRFLAEEALQGNVAMVEKEIRIPAATRTGPAPNVERFRELVSVLVYDIRGSTFMGTKLYDARRENDIRNLFQESMLTVVEKFGGIPIKDTGDGGIVLFAENGYEIKQHKTLEVRGGSVLNAVRVALGMIQEARNFAEENIDKYKDWFHQAEERNINFEGISYATLPPSYQAIFQIGVGIASGVYPREVFLDRNPFGDLDLTGMLVREANFYSKVKAKGKSTAICDDMSVYNLLLNTQKFSFRSESGLNIDPVLLDIEQGLEYWVNQKVSRHGFIFDLYKIFVTEMGQEITHPGSLKILLGIKDAISLDETGEIKDGKGGRGKFLFEITPEVGQ